MDDALNPATTSEEIARQHNLCRTIIHLVRNGLPELVTHRWLDGGLHHFCGALYVTVQTRLSLLLIA